MKDLENSLNSIIWMALRYAIPRHTAALSIVKNVIELHLDCFTRINKEEMIEEIKNYLRHNPDSKSVYHEIDNRTLREIIVLLEEGGITDE